VPLGEEIPLERGHQRGVPPRLEIVILPPLAHLAWKRLQIDIYLPVLHTIKSTADELSGGTNMDDLERPWTPKIGVLRDFFCYFRLRHSEFSLKYTGDRPWQSAYEIKLMRWRVSWALAQISCSAENWRTTLCSYSSSGKRSQYILLFPHVFVCELGARIRNRRTDGRTGNRRNASFYDGRIRADLSTANYNTL